MGDWRSIRRDERPVGSYGPHGLYTLGLAYANTYHIGMSSLGFQRVYELVHQYPEWSCERLFADGTGVPLSVETETPLSAFGVVAFSVSFEEDYVNLLQMLDRAKVPRRRHQRRASDPLIIMGGSCAAINPLTMSEFVDVFALGAAENLLTSLLAAVSEETDKGAVLERLAATPGFFIPEHHRPRGARDGQAPQAGAQRRPTRRAGKPAHHRHRHAAHRVCRQVPDRDVQRLSREVPLLLGDLWHGTFSLASCRVSFSTRWKRRDR